MFGINFESLLDIDNISDAIQDGLGMFGKTISDLFDGDGFAGATNFSAVVISNPIEITVQEAEALGFSLADADAERSYRKFKVRINEKSGNPHAILADPCDISSTTEPCIQNALVSAHTTIVTNEIHGIRIGSFVDIGLYRNANKTYNLQTGRLVKVHGNDTTGHSVLDQEACEELKIAFENGGNYIPPPTIELPSEIRELAEVYDKTSQIPNKSQHRPFLYGDHPPSLNQPFEMWFKAFIAKIFLELGAQYKVEITSGFRTVLQQTALRRKYLARKAANPDDSSKWGLPAACGTCSRHIGGAAIDINFTYINLLYTSKIGDTTEATKNIWEQTRIPEIAKSLGLIWGGDFKSTDVVHFEYVPFDNFQDFAAQNAGRTVRYDTVDRGRTTAEDMRDQSLTEGAETSVPKELDTIAAIGDESQTSEFDEYGDIIESSE